MTAGNSDIWDGAYKIPWDNPEFSRRMLKEHLSQEHDLASRKANWIDAQVEWLNSTLQAIKPARILDLGCGPGFYSHRLCAAGHNCLGIDFGPASIEYAGEHNPDSRKCRFVQGDIRYCDYAGPHDLAMLLYGEMNVFSPGEVKDILRRAYDSIAPGGKLLLEIQTAQAVERSGRAASSEQVLESGLFSDKGHTLRVQSEWLEDERVAVQSFYVTETGSSQAMKYRSTTKAWSDEELDRLLSDIGFTIMFRCNDWPGNTEDLVLRSAVKV